MKKLLIVMCLGLAGNFYQSTVHADIQYLYDSPLNIQQTVNNIGNGLWEYSFSFNNTDISQIAHFVIYTPEITENITGSFEYDGRFLVENAYSPYDPRHIDPTLTYMNAMWYGCCEGIQYTYGLNVGDSATLSFQSSYQGERFLYIYETVDSGYARDNGGFVASMGYTTVVPEPISSILFVTGGTLLAGRRYIKRTKKA